MHECALPGVTAGRRDTLLHELRLKGEPYKTMQARVGIAVRPKELSLEESNVLRPPAPLLPVPVIDESLCSPAAGVAKPASSTDITYRPEDIVIDWDIFVQICLNYWQDQTHVDLVRVLPPPRVLCVNALSLLCPFTGHFAGPFFQVLWRVL